MSVNIYQFHKYICLSSYKCAHTHYSHICVFISIYTYMRIYGFYIFLPVYINMYLHLFIHI